MKEKFTKGEWLAVKEGVYIRHESDDQSDGMLQAIAYIESYDLPEEWQSNAALIATAPEMYEMLEDCYCHLFNNCHDDESKELIKKIIELRKKARGEK